MKKILLYLSAFSIALPLLVTHVASADSLTYQANETWDESSCTFSVNGSPFFYDPAQVGDTVNVVVNNNTPQGTSFFMNVNFSGDANHGGTQEPYNIGPGQSVTVTFSNIQSNSFVYISGGDCNSNNTNDSYLWVKPATATLSCSTVTSNRTWSVTGNYTNILSGAIYSGSSPDGTTSGGNGSINKSYVAGSSPTVFYFYDGNNSSGRLLAQANCPAITTSATNPSSSAPKNTTTNTTYTTPKSSISTNSNKIVSPPKKVRSSSTGLLIGSGIVVLVIILSVIILGVLGIWKGPQHIIKRLRKQLRKLFSKGFPSTPSTPSA
ncbi:MAG: hypothetical protein ACYCPS_02260 [Candidatus Saccharimonadales bacterium]